MNGEKSKLLAISKFLIVYRPKYEADSLDYIKRNAGAAENRVNDYKYVAIRYLFCRNLSGVKFLCRLLSNDSDCVPDIHMVQWEREMIIMPEKKTKLILAGIAVCLLVFLAVQQIPRDTSKEDFAYIEAEPVIEEDIEESLSEIVVHVAGAVENPGVYTLQEGKRVEDALQMAGIVPDADIDALNRAAVLSDGQKIVVPLKNADGKPMEEDAIEDGLISINQADLTQLMTLPGIGEVKAQAILEYRTQHGGFSSVEEIRQVKGIGESIFCQIKNKIKI